MFHRVILFISSYIPLYTLMVVKNILERMTQKGRFFSPINKLKNAVFFDEINDYAIIVFIIISVISYVYLKNRITAKGSNHKYIVKDMVNQTSNYYFNYISIYLLSCLGLSLNNVVDVFILLFVMLIVGFIYISNRMTYINPMLQMLGYQIYESKVISKSTNECFDSILLAPRNLHICANDIVSGGGKEHFLLITSHEK